MKSHGVTSEGESIFKPHFCLEKERPSGKRTDYPPTHEFYSWEYTYHSDGSLASSDHNELKVRTQPIGLFEKGLSTTRFHKGFQRRRQQDVRQDASRLEEEAQRQRLSASHLARRRERLTALDKRNCFNLITGDFDPAIRRCTTPFHIRPKSAKHYVSLGGNSGQTFVGRCTGGCIVSQREAGILSEEAQRAEYLLLRDSVYKFHAAAWSGENHDKRQDLLHREGLNKLKKSALLGIGRADLPSVGAEDMFSKAVYDPGHTCVVEGLVETTRPGRFTPRKFTREGNSNFTPVSTSPSESRMPSGSESAANVTFRILPTGLGNGTLARTVLAGAVGIPGIAPRKQLAESRSAPSLGPEFHQQKVQSPDGRLRSARCSGNGDRASPYRPKYERSRGVTPTQRRRVDQIARDIAIVRSLSL